MKPTSIEWSHYLGSAIGNYTESEGGSSPETTQARSRLFDIYEEWCHVGRPVDEQAGYRRGIADSKPQSDLESPESEYERGVKEGLRQAQAHRDADLTELEAEAVERGVQAERERWANEIRLWLNDDDTQETLMDVVRRLEATDG